MQVSLFAIISMCWIEDFFKNEAFSKSAVTARTSKHAVPYSFQTINYNFIDNRKMRTVKSRPKRQWGKVNIWGEKTRDWGLCQLILVNRFEQNDLAFLFLVVVGIWSCGNFKLWVSGTVLLLRMTTGPLKNWVAVIFNLTFPQRQTSSFVVDEILLVNGQFTNASY